jgi:acetyl-CoA acetyltransferase
MVGDVAAAAVAVEAEGTTWADIDIVNENHAVSLQQEGEHRTLR